LPVAAYAKANAEGEIYLQALVAESDGSAILRADGRGDNPQALAQSVVGKLLDQGAQTILDNARHD
jgi:hydroxymethylbilane synthase